jgi:hypothetical protein
VVARLGDVSADGSTKCKSICVRVVSERILLAAFWVCHFLLWTCARVNADHLQKLMNTLSLYIPNKSRHYKIVLTNSFL